LAPLTAAGTLCESTRSQLPKFLPAPPKMQAELEAACQVIGRLGSHDSSRNAVREHQGIRRMVLLLKRRETQPGLAQALVEALTVLVADNEVNQDDVREEGGVVEIIRLLDTRVSKPLAASAISCVTGASGSPHHTCGQEASALCLP
jgi:hypothetical protein